MPKLKSRLVSFGAISGWNATLHRNAEQLKTLSTLLCSVAFQPEMALVMHLVYHDFKSVKSTSASPV